MAQNAFVSKYHFIRRFKAEVGLTPHQFQLQNRIRKAQRLMHKAETSGQFSFHLVRIAPNKKIGNHIHEKQLETHEVISQNRIRKAQRLMHKAETITDVALTTGFCDQSHFIKQFKKQVGLSPLTYKLSSQTIESEEMRQHNAGINFANR